MTTESALTPPQAKKVPVTRTHHGDTFTDHYEWLRDKESQEVLNHLHAENAYTDAVAAEQKTLRESIFQEIKHRTVETDLSVPARRGDWWYFSRTIEGQQHPIYCRVPVQDAESEGTAGDSTADGGSTELAAWTPPEVEPGVALEGEETYFDTNAEAEHYPFYQIGGMSLDRHGELLAYCEDTSGDEHYTLRFRDLTTGKNLSETVENVHGGPVLEPTGQRAYYMVADETWRPYRLYVHTVGTDAAEDRLLLEITNEELWTGIGLSADKRDLLIFSGNSEYNETRILDVASAKAEPRLLIGAEQRLLHSVDPIELDGERLLLITHNQSGPNNSLSMTTEQALRLQPAGSEQLYLGIEVLPHEDTVKFEGVTVTSSQVLVAARRDTVESVYLLSLDALRAARDAGQATATSALPTPGFEEELYGCFVTSAQYEAPLFRVLYTSWLTPMTIYDIPHQAAGSGSTAASPEPILRRRTPVNDVDLSAYRSTRLWAETGEQDATGSPVHIPITVLHHKDVTPSSRESPENGRRGNPTVVYGYGSYEISMDPQFSVARLSLLDRGIVYAVAHVRGGGELGRRWYEDGKKLKKINTFTDFLTVTDHLVETGWADPQRTAAMGGSAGGLLMGAIVNMAPEKYCAVVAEVPFVDNLTSILDPDLPLSALEWEEWGNPITDKDVYEYMKSYSPYENVRDAEYPPIAAVTSLHDTRVLYVEPAKWVQVLREHQRGKAPIVLKIEMEGGHGGASGRYETWKEVAWDYAWLIHHLDVHHLDVR